MNTSQIQCFLTVADTLNFARAAEQLHITQPAVTQQIHALEKELGVRLFHRTTHSVRMTEEGMLFLADARQMAAISDRAKKRFARQSADVIETLTIGCMHVQSMLLLSAPLARMKSEHPTLHPQIQMVPFQHIYRFLDEGSLDVVAEFQNHAASSFVYREMLRSPMVCICAEGYPLTAWEELDPEQLRSYPLILPTPAQVPPAVHKQQEALLGERMPSELYFCDTVNAIAVLAAAGYGVSVLPSLLVPDLSGVRQIPLRGSRAISFGLYYKNLKDHPLLKNFVACARMQEHCERPAL